MWRRASIHTQLTGYVALLVLLVFGTGIVASVVVARLSQNAAIMDQKWLAGTRNLSFLGDQISKFRLAETDRDLRTDAQSASDAEANAQRHRNAIAGAILTYATTLGTSAEGTLSAFKDAWADYLLVHDAWVRASVYRNTNSLARASSSLDWRYRVVDEALATLEAQNDQDAQAESAAAERLAVTLNYVVAGAAIVGLVMALGLSALLRQTITRPLGSMTAALTQLAGGRLDTSVPELDQTNEIGQLAKAFEVFRANAAELEQAHEETRAALQQADLLARHDALTGLQNRRVFAAELDSALGRSAKGIGYCAVMSLDLDGFKSINDVQGHAVGDQVLCEVARRLVALPADRKVVARLGGDEFAVIIETAADVAFLKREAMSFAARVLAAIHEPILVGEAWVEVGASLGIACCPTDGQVAEDIVRGSNLAMYRAKQSGRGTYRFFEQRMDEELRQQALIEDSLRQAIRTGGIRPFYQPLICLNDDRVHGFEVLARWHHPEQGAIPPDRFIAMAERLGLIEELTANILRQACRDTRAWGDEIRIAVNVSPSQLTDRRFPDKVLSILAEERFPPTRLDVEITESALVGDIELAKRILTALRSAGVSVSMDDFGTGYSSLYHLRNLTFDKLKLDRSFVQSMRTNTESAKIVDAVLGLARSLGMPVVAEGIEDQAALSHLAARGCDFGQGFFFSKAVPPEVAAAMISNRTSRRSA